MTFAPPVPHAPRLPCALVLDASEAMPPDAMRALNQALRDLRATLYDDPAARDVVELSVATFGRTAETQRGFAAPGWWHLPTLHAAGTAALGDALECAMNEIAERTAQYRDVGLAHRRARIVVLAGDAPDARSTRAATRLRRELHAGHLALDVLALTAGAAHALEKLVQGSIPVRVVSVDDLDAAFAGVGRGLRRLAAA